MNFKPWKQMPTPEQKPRKKKTSLSAVGAEKAIKDRKKKIKNILDQL